MNTADAMSAKRDELEAGEFRARAVTIDGEETRRTAWQHCIGCRNAAHAAEVVGLDELAFGDSVAVVEVEEREGPTRRFRVVMKIKVTGEVTELKNDEEIAHA